ncbi:hypothetical protein BDV36DRAFT_243437 [Aspergillus pseudocaelatus]|uniref:Ketoreductase (KR) domain-containing protein n=1 Tax=Aspergillus pseudocaelatus TaxID=1825620 RepID=A0ABQ6X282_9EURO|nr:hypothetical protein BDV36DRAFT_243437 [Aspergillus pseudocaelatus]
MVEISQVDVSDYDSVSRFAHAAASHGPIEAVIHTAGLSPSTGCAQKILEVDLLGTANALDDFLEVAQSGTSMVCIASMAGQMGSGLPSELERHLGRFMRPILMALYKPMVCRYAGIYYAFRLQLKHGVALVRESIPFLPASSLQALGARRSMVQLESS